MKRQELLLARPERTTSAAAPPRCIAAAALSSVVLLSGLWGSSEAEAATFTSQLLTNLPPSGGAAFSSDPSTGVALGGFFYFAASDGQNGTTGRELWRTDGTPTGTTLVKDINPGLADSSPSLLTVAGTNLFFVADDGTHGTELWKSDGTENGTVLVADVTPGGVGSKIVDLSAAGNVVYFAVQYPSSTNLSAFYRSDGTAQGTIQLAGPSGLLTTNGVALAAGHAAFGTWSTNAVFPESVATHTNALWRTDGTVSGSTKLETVGRDNYVYAIRVIDPEVYYVSELEGGSLLLLRRSLSPGGTSESLTNAFPGELSIQPIVNIRLYYSLLAGGCGFVSCDFVSAYGSVANGEPPTTIDGVPDSFFAPSFGTVGILGGLVYYTNSLYPTKVFQTDGTTAGTLALDFQPLGMTFSEMLGVGSHMFFTGGTTNTGLEIGMTDFTPGGTFLLADVRPGADGSNPHFLGALGTQVLFSADDGTSGNELWTSDGTTNGTRLLKDIAPGLDSPPPSEAVGVGSTVFVALPRPGLGGQLWKCAGTPAGSLLLASFSQPGYGPTNLTACNGLLYFVANDGTNGLELWRSDGTTAGTYMLKDCRVGPAGSNPSELTAAGSLLFFVADDGAHGAELWVSDGTSNGTSMALDIVPGLDPGEIGNMQAVGETVYFIAKSGSLGRQLWFSTGQPGGTQFLYDLNPGSGDSFPTNFTAFAGAVYFVNRTGTLGLWRTDGTPSGTVLLITNSITGDITGELQVAGSSLFGVGSSSFGPQDTQLWLSDGSTAGTMLLTNLPAPASQLRAVGSTLYFSVSNDLWSADASTGLTALAADFSTLNPPMVSPQLLTPFQGALLFTEGGPPFGRELWSIVPGQVASLVEDLNPGAADANINFLIPVTNQALYFARPPGQAAWQLRSLRMQTLLPPPKGPWGGSPWPVPGLIEAENFDLGGEGQGYHDLTLVNEGGQYRKTEAVDIYVCDDTNGGFSVGATQPGEWMEYSMQAAATGTYELDVRMTSAAVDTGDFHLEVDGVSVAAGVVLNNGTPGGWFTEAVSGIPLTAGPHVLRLAFDPATSAGDAGIYNWLEFVLTASNEPPIVTIQSPPSGAVFPVGGSITLAASVVDATPGTGVQAEFFIDGQSVGVTSGPYSLSWTATPGPHVLRVTATDSFGASSTSRGQLFFVTDPVVGDSSSWRVNAFGTNAGTSWRSTAFDDSHWPRARAPLGFGYAGVTLMPSNLNNSPIITYYFRQSFTNDLSAMNYASITLKRDDAAAVYLNNREVARRNLPQPPTNFFYNTLALTNVRNNAVLTNPAVDSIQVPLALVSNPTNLIAVEVHQGRPALNDHFDLYFSLAFAAYPYNPGTALGIQAVTNTAVVQWPDYLPDWQLEQSPDLAAWTAVTNSPVYTNSLSILQLPIQTRMFFRLHQVPLPLRGSGEEHPAEEGTGQQAMFRGGMDRPDFVKTLAETCEKTGFQLQEGLERAAQERPAQTGFDRHSAPGDDLDLAMDCGPAAPGNVEERQRQVTSLAESN